MKFNKNLVKLEKKLCVGFLRAPFAKTVFIGKILNTVLSKAGLAYTAKRGKRLNRIGLGRNSQAKLVWFCRACTTAPLSRRDSPIYALRLCRHCTLPKLCARTFTPFGILNHCNISISQVPTRL